MLACKALKAQTDRIKVQDDITNFLSEHSLEIGEIKISQVVRGGKILTFIIYEVK
jgi:hypothetical protein